MTARSVSWTDPRELRALLDRVTGDKPGQRQTAVRPMSTHTPARAPFPREARNAFPHVTAPAPAAGAAAIPAQPAPAKPAAPALAALPVIESDNPSDRLDALLLWTMDNHRCSGAFIADDNGLTLAAHGVSDAHVSIVGPLLSSLHGIRTVPGIDATSGALWLGAQMMSWVEVKTESGGFCMGILADEALHPRVLDRAKEALQLTVRGL
ncbi:MAG: hypothetical protein IPK82_17555 [Polyangiaceae bacterium]|nr:hypothetical protein [Polyangiaceae bacterium]